MLGVLVNTGAIILGGILGLLLKKILKENIKDALTTIMGICIVVIGIMDAIKTTNALILIISLVIGTLIGTLLKLQERIEKFGNFLEKKFTKSGDSTVGIAFTKASLIFCIGAMVVYGSMQSGLGNPNTLYVKAALDGIIAMTLSATLGFGVILSAVPVFIIESIIALLAKLLLPIVTDEFLAQLSGIGGCLVITIGINLLKIKEIKTADLAPAIFGCFLVFLF